MQVGGENILTRDQYLLCKLAEEASEVAQRSLKAAYFGLEEEQCLGIGTNRVRLIRELNDMLSSVDMLNNEYNFNFEPDTLHVEVNQEKINKYYMYAADLGRMHD